MQHHESIINHINIPTIIPQARKDSLCIERIKIGEEQATVQRNHKSRQCIGHMLWFYGSGKIKKVNQSFNSSVKFDLTFLPNIFGFFCESCHFLPKDGEVHGIIRNVSKNTCDQYFENLYTDVHTMNIYQIFHSGNILVVELPVFIFASIYL